MCLWGFNQLVATLCSINIVRVLRTDFTPVWTVTGTCLDALQWTLVSKIPFHKSFLASQSEWSFSHPIKKLQEMNFCTRLKGQICVLINEVPHSSTIWSFVEGCKAQTLVRMFIDFITRNVLMRTLQWILFFVCFWRNSPSGPWPPRLWGFYITQRRTTVGRTPLEEWSARRRDLYLTTHNIHNRHTSMSPMGFEPTISVAERSQTYSWDRAATGTGYEYCYGY